MGKIINYEAYLDKLCQVEKSTGRQLVIINGLYDWVVNAKRKSMYNYEVD